MPTRAFRIVFCILAAWLLGGAAAYAAPVVISTAQSVRSDAPRYPEGSPEQTVQLPDDWSQSRPRFDGSVWYRVRFETPPGVGRDDLLAVLIERVCTNLEVNLNGRRIFDGGRMAEPPTRNCHYPQLVTLPGGLLQSSGNHLDIRVIGSALQNVTARQRAGRLSALKIGRQAELAGEYRMLLFWNVQLVEGISLTLFVLGSFLLVLFWMNRRQVALMYCGSLLVAWSLLSARVWWRDMPLDTLTIELIGTCIYPPIAALAVQFLLSHAGVRSRPIESVALLQCVLMPLSLVAIGTSRLYALANAWYSLLALELFAVAALYLNVLRKQRRPDFAPMMFILVAIGLVLLLELGVQMQWLARPLLPLTQAILPALLLVIGVRQLQMFSHALRLAEFSRTNLEQRVKEATGEMERNFAQLSQLRVEQVTEKERKRIAADLHDDLGAKLLTIVHTSESERISTLAREALEEMRLSVRGLTGKPVRLADALADWRAETVLRLGQANIEADWQGPAEEVEHLLPARAYVQTTRILREAVSNIIKHSGASHCSVRSMVGERDFGLLVQDNGHGIPMELDGKLDRGHGMSSMKHRAKQLQGQCLVESGPGYGTVIRLTLPL